MKFILIAFFFFFFFSKDVFLALHSYIKKHYEFENYEVKPTLGMGFDSNSSVFLKNCMEPIYQHFNQSEWILPRYEIKILSDKMILQGILNLKTQIFNIQKLDFKNQTYLDQYGVAEFIKLCGNQYVDKIVTYKAIDFEIHFLNRSILKQLKVQEGIYLDFDLFINAIELILKRFEIVEVLNMESLTQALNSTIDWPEHSTYHTTNYPIKELPETLLKDLEISELLPEEIYDPKNEENDDSCEKAVYNKGTGKSCGVKLYFKKQSPACGVKLYKNQVDRHCPNYERPEGPKILKMDWVSCLHHYKIETTLLNLECRDTLGPGWQFLDVFKDKTEDTCETSWIDLKYRHYKVFTRCIKNAIPASCRHPSHEIEEYKTCRHPFHGVEQYNTCRSPEFGVQYLESTGC